MAHFAELDSNNIVLNVLVVSNEQLNNLPFPDSEPVGIDFLISLFGSDKIWKQTSYNGTFRKNFAQIGYTYDATRDAFIRPKPSTPINRPDIIWVFNEEICDYETILDPNIPRPTTDTVVPPSGT